MPTAAPARLINCQACQTPLPIRLPKPGEVGSSWQCATCNARYFGVLDDNIGQKSMNNIVAAAKPNPRIMVGREIVAQLFRREPMSRPVLDARQHPRKVSTESLTVILHKTELPANSLDVSIGGLACVVPIEVPFGREVLLRFGSLPNAPICIGVVRSCDPIDDGYRLGIAFTK